MAAEEEVIERPTIDSLMVADFAESINGKLYVMGGGWDRIVAGQFPHVQFWLAGILRVPWGDTNRRLPLRGWVETAEGVEFEWRLEGEIEAGRAPGQRGRPSNIALAGPVAFDMEDAGDVVLKLEFAGDSRAIPIAVFAPGQPMA